MKPNDAVAPALILVLLGAWLSAESMAPQMLNSERTWPLLIAAAGVCFLIGYLSGAGPWQLFLGFTAALSGLGLWLFTGGIISWHLLPAVWPVFLVFFGAGLLAYMAAAQGAPWPLLVPGIGAVLTGASGLLFSLGVVGFDPIEQLRLIWPVLLVVTGFLGLMQAIYHSLSSGN
jgi:hypothetical protein